jgi:hypothetical protein
VAGVVTGRTVVVGVLAAGLLVACSHAGPASPAASGSPTPTFTPLTDLQASSVVSGEGFGIHGRLEHKTASAKVICDDGLAVVQDNGTPIDVEHFMSACLKAAGPPDAGPVTTTPSVSGASNGRFPSADQFDKYAADVEALFPAAEVARVGESNFRTFARTFGIIACGYSRGGKTLADYQALYLKEVRTKPANATTTDAQLDAASWVFWTTALKDLCPDQQVG